MMIRLTAVPPARARVPLPFRPAPRRLLLALAVTALGIWPAASQSASAAGRAMAARGRGAPAAAGPRRAAGPATTITVNTTVQGVNTDGLCSLQEAIFAANLDASQAFDPANPSGPKITTGCTAGNGADTIVLEANAVYQMSGTVIDPYNTTGPTATPTITSTVTIEGNGARLERTGTLNIRALTTADGSQLTIRNLHITGFRARGGDGGSGGGGGGLGGGGAIFSRGTLVVENCTFSGNTATGGNGGAGTSSAAGITTIGGGGGGGGVSGDGGAGPNFSNLVIGGGGGGGAAGDGGAGGQTSGGGGGGTVLPGDSPGGSFTAAAGGFRCGGGSGSFLGGANGFAGTCEGGGGGGGGYDGSSGSGGGGAFGGGGGGASFGFNGAGNVGGDGGLPGGGGGGGSSTFNVSNGGAGGDGGDGGNLGGGGGGGGGLLNADGTGTGGAGGSGGSFGGGTGGAGTVANVLIAGTVATSGPGGGGGGVGGAILAYHGNVTIRNSTFQGNTATGGAAGGTGASAGTSYGGAVAFLGGGEGNSLTVVHVTISDNTAANASGLLAANFDGFGLYNTIIANGPGKECETSDLDGNGSGAGNLIESNGDCPGVVSAADPQLGPLAITAPGNTPTMSIGSASPAFNAAAAAFGLSTDQRGVARPQGTGFDIGAFEVLVADVSVTKSCYARPIAGSPTQDADVVMAGQQWICDIVVSNPSSNLVGDVSITDSVPAGARFVASTVAEAQIGGAMTACTPPPLNGPGTVTCTGIDVAPQSTARFQLAFFVSPDYVAAAPTGELPISDTACVTVQGFIDPDVTNNCDTETDLVKDLADLRVSKFVESTHDPVRAGEVFTYTIFVDNLGPSVARTVTITDTFLSSNSVSIQSCAFSVSQGGGAITQFSCTTGNLVSTQFGTDIGTMSTNRLDPAGVVGSPSPNGGHQGRLRASFRLVARTDLQTTNTVRVASLTPDPDKSNNFATANLRAISVADLSVTKAASAEEQQTNQPGLIFNNAVTGQVFPTAPNYFASTRVTAGRRIQYTVQVRNNGISAAENVVLFDRLPLGVRIYQGSLVATYAGAPAQAQPTPRPGANCDTGTPGNVADPIRCGIGTLSTGQTYTLVFEVITDSSLTPGAVLENDAWVTSGTLDVNNGNNMTFTQNTVLAAADMGVAKTAVGQVVTSYNAALHQFVTTDTAGQVTAGKVLRYQIQVQNNGPSDGRNVTVQENLPTSPVPGPVTFLRASGATCRPDSVNQNLMFCDLGDMAAGARKTFDLYVTVDPSVPVGTLLSNTATALQSGSNTVPPGPPPAIPGVDPTRPITWDPCVACGPAASANASTNGTSVTAVADVFVTKADVPADPKLGKPFLPNQAVAGREHRYKITIGNAGPSTALGVGVTDVLDLKQPGLLGERFLRCEPFDLDDQVTCSFAALNTVTLTHLQVGNENVVPTAGTGTLTAGSTYSFYLITTVDEGYVLDGTDLLATDTANITTTTTDFRAQNNQDRHDTLIIAEADLSLLKVDDAAGFLRCDPVAPGGTITYDITVTNNGPSDAADVFVVDQLPVTYVVADPAQVTVTVSRGQVVEVRDDGQITIRVGNDVNNSGVAQLGRLNAPGSPGAAPVTIRIVAKVRADAACGGSAENVARVETRRNDAVWPIAPQPQPGLDGGPRTPTIDPSTANNTDNELTKIECPAVQVIKTVSFDGTCPGVNISAGVFNRTGQPVTFCFEVTNTGTTFLDNIFLSDVLDTRTLEPTVIFTDTITAGADPKLPIKPGETVLRRVTIPQLECECGIATDTATVTANPVNSGRTDLPCLTDVTDTDRADIDVPCAGVDWRLQLPILGGTTCQTLIQVQNLGRTDTKVILVAWGDESFCPPQAAGPLKVECGGLLRPGSAWTFTASQLPATARSAVLYSVNATDLVTNVDGNQSRFDLEVCDALMTHVVGNWKQWSVFDLAYRRQLTYRSPFDHSGLHQFVLDFKTHQGEPIAATVNRACPDAADPNVTSNAVYTGISSDQEGARDPVSGARMFYAPLVFVNKGGLTSKICIQNSGDECTSLELWFKAQDACLRNTLADVLTLSPGESTCFDPSTVVGPDWLGSAYIRSTQPLGIVVDTMGPSHFTAYNGLPADVFALGFSAGNQVSYLPLTYSEYQGWDSAIQVQNLDPTVSAKVKVYFLDRSGDIVTTLVDWVCARGSQTFFLPVIANLPGQWAGSARVESQEWVTPGGPNILAPRVMAVALLERWSDPARTSRREAIAYNGQGECLLYDWQLGSGAGGTASGAAVLALPLVAKANRGINTEVAITNLVPKPGFTDFVVFFYDQNGLIEQVCQKFSEKEVDYISLDGYGFLDRGYLGSAVVSAVFWEHDVFDDHGVFLRNVVGMGAVAIERMGTAGAAGADVPGDESKGYEAFPVFATYKPNDPLRCPGVPVGFGGR